MPIINTGLGPCRVKGERASSNSRRKVLTMFELAKGGGYKSICSLYVKEYRWNPRDC